MIEYFQNDEYQNTLFLKVDRQEGSKQKSVALVDYDLEILEFITLITVTLKILTISKKIPLTNSVETIIIRQ